MITNQTIAPEATDELFNISDDTAMTLSLCAWLARELPLDMVGRLLGITKPALAAIVAKEIPLAYALDAIVQLCQERIAAHQTARQQTAAAVVDAVLAAVPIDDWRVEGPFRERAIANVRAVLNEHR